MADLQIYLPDDLYERLRRYSLESNQSMNDVVLATIERELARLDWQKRLAQHPKTDLGLEAATLLHEERSNATWSWGDRVGCAEASAVVECLLRTSLDLTVASELIGADHVKTDGQELDTLPVHWTGGDLAFWKNQAYNARIAPDVLLQVRLAK